VFLVKLVLLQQYDNLVTVNSVWLVKSVNYNQSVYNLVTVNSFYQLS